MRAYTYKSTDTCTRRKPLQMDCFDIICGSDINSHRIYFPKRRSSYPAGKCIGDIIGFIEIVTQTCIWKQIIKLAIDGFIGIKNSSFGI